MHFCIFRIFFNPTSVMCKTIIAHVHTTCMPVIHNLHIHLNTNLTSLSPILSGCSLKRKALGECVCQKVTQSAHHAETAQTSSVLWGVSVCLCVGVSEWIWVNGRVGGGVFREGQSRGKTLRGLHQSFQFLRSPPLHACYIVKPEATAGLYLVPHSLLATVIIQHYER